MLSPPSPQLEGGSRYKTSVPTQFSNPTAVRTVLEKGLMSVEGTLWGSPMGEETWVLFPVNCYRVAAESFLTQNAALLMLYK